ncbi:hypothetical protein [Bradyrhizobium neotropicale]|uniref:hypothetical protein n=1 Tax=Bradyrhizobium neotropicale TaxID=1497615 RepID=UPI001AD6EFF2|nr:hypothetical protein [Bradyrhizobium neotropicale]MBO4221044.1 hypothetical protein [Bradyrhizobium neotropicale]
MCELVFSEFSGIHRIGEKAYRSPTVLATQLNMASSRPNSIGFALTMPIAWRRDSDIVK